MKKLLKKIALLAFLCPSILSHAQTLVSAPIGTTTTSSPADSRAIGWAGRETFSYTNGAWPSFVSPCLTYGFRDTLYQAINGYNTQPPNGGCSGSSNLVYSAALSNLAGGILVYTGTTTYGYYNTSFSWTTSVCNVRATITLTNTAAAAIPIFSFGSAKVIRANQNFNVKFLMESFSPASGAYFAAGPNQWVPSIELYDDLHTDPNSSICTSFSWGAFYTFSITGTATNTGPYCEGSSITLNSSATSQTGGTISYAWSGPSYVAAGANQTILNSNTSMSGTYTVIETESVMGCVGSGSTVVTVNPIPVVSATASPTTICSGNASTLTGSGGTTYNWMPGSLTGTTVSVTPSSTTTYTVTGTSAGCSSIANVTVTVNPTPTVSATASPTTICSGSASTLTASGGTTYNWMPGSLTGTSVSVTPATTTTYTVTGTTTGCSSTSLVTVTVNPTPTVSATASPTTICSGSASTLTASGGTTYNWMPGSLTGTSVSVTPATTTTYTVTGTSTGCSSTSLVTVTVNPTPTVSATASPSTICSGSASTLTASGGTTYDWMPGSLTGTSVSVTPATTTTYTVTGTTTGCSSTSLVTVTVNPTPTVSATASPSTICAGSSSTLTGSGATTYTWMPGSLSGTTVSDSPSTTTTYTVTGTSTGCSSTANVTVTVNPLPTVTANSTAAAVCSGNSVTLTGGGATSYTWDNSVTDGVSFVPTTTTTYMVTGTDGNGCSNTATTTVTVNPTPTVVATATSTTICDGSSTSLSATGALAYVWNPGNIIGSTISVSPTTTTTFTVTGGTVAGCLNTTSIVITVNPLPTVTANATATVVCTGTSVTLTGGGATSYTWDNSVSDGISFVPTSTITYNVIGTDANGCMNTASTTVTVNPLPTVTANATATVVCTGTSVTLTGGGATSYTWDNSVSDGISFTPSSTTTYMVTGTDANGCMNTATTTVTVNPLPTVVANSTATVVCAGTNVTLTGSGATFYTWDNSVMDGVSFVPTSTVTYMVTGTDANGCNAMDMITVAVNPLPTVTANSTATVVCAGTSVTLTGGGATSYTWDNSVIDGISFIPSTSTTYMVTGTDGNGCMNTATTTVIVNPLPTVTATSTASAVCSGNSVILNGGGATSYTWDNSVLDGISFVPTTTVNYMVIGTDANGCTNTATITVTVNPLPTVIANSTATAVCTGTSITLTGSGATTYTWDNSVSDGISFVPTTTTTYMVTGTDANGCSNTAMTTVTVNPLPTVTANATATVVCAGASVTLTGGGAATYSWDNSVTDGISFVPLATTTYMVTGTDANGCSNTAMTTVTVNSLPTVTANSTATFVCAGGSITLTGGGATSYTWTGGAIDAVSFVPASTTTFTVTGTDANTCSSTATITVTVNPLPAVTANTTASTVCAGTSVTLTGGGATTYSWSGGVTDGISFVPVSTLTYTVTGTDGNGCVNTATTSVTVNANPVVNVGPDQAVCSGTILLDAGNPGDTYAWSDLSTAQTLSVSTSGNYWVDVTNASGCTSRDSATITINANPVVVLGADITQCGGTVTLDAGNAGAIYTWSDGSTSQMLTVSSSGTYFVTDTLTGGCYASDTIVVVINPVPAIDLGLDVTQCGGTVTLNAGNSGATYLWSTTATTQTISVSTSGTYYVDVTNASGCTTSDTVMVTINTPPAVTATATSTVVCVDDAAVALTGTPAGGTWSGPGVTGSTFSPIGAGLGSQTTTYTFTDINNCTATATATIQVNACTGIVENTLANMVSVFPNPNSGSFTISMNASVGDMSIVLCDMEGRVVYSSMESNVNAGFVKTISLDNVSNGVYMLRLTAGAEQQIIKVSVQK